MWNHIGLVPYEYLPSGSSGSPDPTHGILYQGEVFFTAFLVAKKVDLGGEGEIRAPYRSVDF